MIVVGVELGWLGFPVFAPDKLCFFSGRVSNLDTESKQYLVDGVAVNGVSGGPAFYIRHEDKNPVVVGTVSSYYFNRQKPDGESHDLSLPGLSVVNDVSLMTRLNIVEE